MLRTALRTCAAIGEASAAVAATITLAVAPNAHADDTWGAIAVAQGSRYGVGQQEPNQRAAESAAVARCMGGYPDNWGPCRVLVVFQSPNCGAVAQLNSDYVGGTGPTISDAKNAALAQLPGSGILVSACAQGG